MEQSLKHDIIGLRDMYYTLFFAYIACYICYYYHITLAGGLCTTHGIVFCYIVLHATCYNRITLAWGMRSVLPLLSELTLARLLITFSPGKDDDEGDRIGNFQDCLILINRVLESWNYFPKYEINIYSSSAKKILESSCAICLLKKKNCAICLPKKALSRHDGSWEF